MNGRGAICDCTDLKSMARMCGGFDGKGLEIIAFEAKMSGFKA